MKVYVIEAGCYSDRHIVGVASEIKVAEAIKEANDRISGDVADISEYETDVYVPLLNRRLLRVTEHRNGKQEVQETDCFDVLRSDNSVKVNEVVYWKRVGLTVVHVLAKDEAHALKIAQDLFAEYKAKKEGVAI